jgi:hypothetical protein
VGTVRAGPKGRGRREAGAAPVEEMTAGRRADLAVPMRRAGRSGVPVWWTRTGHRAVGRRAVCGRAGRRAAPHAGRGLVRGERLRGAAESGEWSGRPGGPTRARATRRPGHDERPDPNECQVAGHLVVPRRRTGSGARRRARPRQAEPDGLWATAPRRGLNGLRATAPPTGPDVRGALPPRAEPDDRRATPHRLGPGGRRTSRRRLEPAGPRGNRRTVGRELRARPGPRVVVGPAPRGLPVRGERRYGSTRR